MKTKDIQDKIKALQAEQEATEAFSRDYPSDLKEPDLLVWHHSKISEFGLIFRIKNLDEALDVINALWNHPQVKILPLRLSRGTFTSFKTPAHEPERGEKTSEAVFPVTVKISFWNVEFKFYAMIEGHLLSIDVEFEYNAGFQRYASVYFKTYYGTSKGGRETIRTDKNEVVLKTPAFTGYRHIKWARGSDEYPNDFTLYWTDASSMLDLFTDEALS